MRATQYHMSQLVDDLHAQKCLPIEIIHIIMRYMYRPKPLALTEDIKNYWCSMNKAMEIYHHRYMFFNPKETSNWLLNDIIRYANASRPTNLGIHPKMSDILNRSFATQRKIHDVCFRIMSYYRKVNVTLRIRFFWGLFTTGERLDFLGEYGAVW